MFLKIAKRASGVITQTNKTKWWKIWRFFKRVSKCFKNNFKTKIRLSFSAYFSQNMLMSSDSGEVPIICILVLDFARFTVFSSTRTSTRCHCSLECGKGLLGPVHTYPDIFESATFSFRIHKFPRPHVAYWNRIHPSTRIRWYPDSL